MVYNLERCITCMYMMCLFIYNIEWLYMYVYNTNAYLIEIFVYRIRYIAILLYSFANRHIRIGFPCDWDVELIRVRSTSCTLYSQIAHSQPPNYIFDPTRNLQTRYSRRLVKYVVYEFKVDVPNIYNNTNEYLSEKKSQTAVSVYNIWTRYIYL